MFAPESVPSIADAGITASENDVVTHPPVDGEARTLVPQGAIVPKGKKIAADP
jgi:hypothetical protein